MKAWTLLLFLVTSPLNAKEFFRLTRAPNCVGGATSLSVECPDGKEVCTVIQKEGETLIAQATVAHSWVLKALRRYHPSATPVTPNKPSPVLMWTVEYEDKKFLNSISLQELSRLSPSKQKDLDQVLLVEEAFEAFLKPQL